MVMRCNNQMLLLQVTRSLNLVEIPEVSSGRDHELGG